MAPSERDSGRERHVSRSPRPRRDSRERYTDTGLRRKYSFSPEEDRRRSTRDDRERRRRSERSPERRRDLSRDRERERRRSRDREPERRRSRSRDFERPRRKRRSISIEDSATGRREIESRRSREDGDRQLSTRHERSRSRDRRRRRSRDRSGDSRRRRIKDSSLRSSRRVADSPPPKRRRRSYSPSNSPAAPRSRAALPSQQSQYQQEVDPTAEVPIEKQKPNFNASGLLAKEANTVAGTNTVLKYHEPAEARKPPAKEQWRMYIFKAKDMLDTIHLYSRSCWLLGRDQTIADFAVEHPSISKQHAVVQFRHLTTTNEFGDRIAKVKPYLIDLESANGTRLNGKKIEASRYVELRDGDVVGFGESEREYVMMLPPA